MSSDLLAGWSWSNYLVLFNYVVSVSAILHCQGIFFAFLLSCLNHNLSLLIFYSFIPSRLTSLYINSHASVILYSFSLSVLFWLCLAPYELWTLGQLLTIPNSSQHYCLSDLPLCLTHQRQLLHFVHPNACHLPIFPFELCPLGISPYLSNLLSISSKILPHPLAKTRSWNLSL